MGLFGWCYATFPDLTPVRTDFSGACSTAEVSSLTTSLYVRNSADDSQLFSDASPPHIVAAQPGASYDNAAPRSYSRTGTRRGRRRTSTRP
eukprot:2180245-Pyramimonas_sp.AAC.1